MTLSTLFSAPRGFLGVPASHQNSNFASAVELHIHKQLQARSLPLPLKLRRRPTPCVSASLPEREAEHYSQRLPTPLLDTINYPADMKKLSVKELRQLADELRSNVIFHASKTGGHLESSLGVVELTVALHYVFNAPQDRILWDVGHQTYPHKILTGRRRDKMPATVRAESEYDWWFGTGHGSSSTTISMALGMAVGRDLMGRKNSVVAVIGGDGAMTARQAYDGCLRYSHSDMIVILNDNKQADEYARGTIGGPGSTLFEDLGLYYVGPVDGHNVDDLITTLNDVVKSTKITGPVLVHVITEKARGYPCPERAADKSPAKTQSYTNYFAEALIAEAEQDSKIVAVRAATGGGGGGTGLNDFRRRFPNRCFDVGTTEQHAVTFAAGLARKGLKPFCAIYSSFPQRGYDVDLQKLPVRFAVDRAGLQVGAFDVTSMACLPNMVVMAPSDEAELCHMVATAAAIDDRPSCFRYDPTGNGIGGVPLPPNYKGTPLEIGKGRVLVEGDRVALLGYGSAVQNCLAAASLVERHSGLKITVADARFCKPLDHGLIRSLARSHEVLITVEEGSIEVGGFVSHVAQFMTLDGLLDELKWRQLVLPDRYIEHGSPADQLAEAGLTPSHIADTVFSVLRLLVIRPGL